METLNFKDLLLGMAQIINEKTGAMPIGCVSFNEKTGFYNANSIKDVANFTSNVIAVDGFIKDGVVVMFKSKRKAEKDEKFTGYKVILELNGPYNGEIALFVRTESEYKIFLNPEIWSSRTRTITYKSDDNTITRDYKEPTIANKETGIAEVPDRRASVENRVAFALKNKLRDYEAYEGELLFNKQNNKFEETTKEL